MKRIVSLALLICCVFSLFGCGARTYEDGYDDGYSFGKDEGYSEGYDDGVSDALYEIDSDGMIYDLVSCAEDYAWDTTRWSVVEASTIVSDYLYGTNYYEFTPSREEFIEAVKTLDAFYCYFLDKRYKDKFDDYYW